MSQHRAQVTLQGWACEDHPGSTRSSRLVKHSRHFARWAKLPDGSAQCWEVPAGQGGKGVELHSSTGPSWRSSQLRGSCMNNFQACKKQLCIGRT